MVHGVEMHAFQPAWLTDELNQLLSKLGGRHGRKKRDTVLRLAEGSVVGRTMEDTFRMPECCTRPCWEGKYKKGKRLPGWRDDPDIQAALKVAERRAQYWQDTIEGRRIEQRIENVARARDKLAELAHPAALTLGALLGAENVETRRKSANDILDRADEATASKSAVYEKGEREQRTKLDLTGLPTELLELLAGAIPNGGEGTGGGGEEGAE